MEFDQFCPITKETEILGEKWTILILREMLMGSSRFNELQRGLSMISPAVLTKRLNTLSDYGLIIKNKIHGQKDHEYLPSNAARELLPIFVDIGNLGMKWTRNHLTDNDFDVDFLMLYLQRSIRTEMLPGKKTIIRFHFTELKKQPYWWILVKGNSIDVCVLDPGKEPDVYFTSSVKVLSDIWMGVNTYRKAIRNGDLKAVSRSDLTKNITTWMSNCMFAQK